MKNKIKFIKTEDESTGLFSEEINDIFHSRTGALTEAKQKFVEPIQNFLKYKNKIKILDICYGIGYNSKAILTELFEKQIEIDALEFDKDYVFLSAIIKDCIDDYNLKLFLLEQINNDDNLKFGLEKIIDYIRGNEEFFDASTSIFINPDRKLPYRNILPSQNNSNLHNIYYNYISNSITDIEKNNKYNNKSIKYHIGDARKTIKHLNSKYDVIFLDAFSSQKDPTLWTIDFLSLVKEKMTDNSILVSYSKSTPFRSALVKLGFNVGKTFIDNVDMGTVASLNKKYIINPLSDYDIKLLNTRSGITYKDPNLNLTAKEILTQRETEQKNSKLQSHTQFLKQYSK